MIALHRLPFSFAVWCLTMIVFLPAVSTYSLRGQVDSGRSTIQGPRLGEHLFSPLAGRPNPFIRTVTTVNTGGGISTTLRLPVVELGDVATIAPVGGLAVAVLTARHEQAIKDWFSVHGELQVVGRLGTNVVSLLAQGVNTAIAFELGWNVRILENDRWSIVTGLRLRDGSFTSIDVRRFAEGLIDSGYVTENNRLLDTKPVMRASIDVRPAWTISRAFGLYSVLNFGVEEPRVRGGNYGTIVDGLVALSADWNPVIEVPIGTTVGIEYRQTSEIAASGDGAAKNIFLRLGYTGADEFGLGAQVLLNILPLEGVEDQVTFMTAVIDMRFYF